MNQNWNSSDKDRNDNRSPFQRGQGAGCSGSSLITILLIMAMIPFLFSIFNGSLTNQSEISYTEFRNQLTSGNIEEVTIAGERVSGVLTEPATRVDDAGNELQYNTFITYVPEVLSEEMLALVQEQEVIIDTGPSEQVNWFGVILNALPIVLLLVVGYFILRRSQTQGDSLFTMGKSRATRYNQVQDRVTFADVAGAENTKRELQEVVEYLKDPQRFLRLGGEIPRGLLMVGPPGTGKTLLAKAVAGEAHVPFYSISGSDFMEMFVGVGASRVRNLFQEAKKTAPSIMFIDELDSIGRRRGAGVGGGHDEREQTLNQLLSEMDGFQKNTNVIVMAATNRPDILDPALLRPGRFDRRVTIDLPTLKDRVEILEIHSRNKPLAEDVNLTKIARGTPGFSGADLANLLNEAALIAARKDKSQIEMEDINSASDKVLLGLERENLSITPDEARLLAYHEAGHAVVAAVLPNTDPIHKVTIVPRGRSMGVTQQLPERDRYLYPREYMLDRLAVMMGGRAAEELVLNTSTSGAEHDLKQATRLVRKMVLSWGMSERLGNIAFGDENDEVFLGEELGHRREYSEATAHQLDEEIVKILKEAFKRAKDTLIENRAGLDRIVDALIMDEEISGARVKDLLGLQNEDMGHVPTQLETA
jgi:cell division protease FtsH